MHWQSQFTIPTINQYLYDFNYLDTTLKNERHKQGTYISTNKTDVGAMFVTLILQFIHI
jgi:hypothetical protein